ncbi:pectin lyase fold/virulence factor [Filobasidium floriforme]|uniref:pectin lyase fold/virulence factor n=1 Tax=Filobasidium floriforme TaxID=5210 RepID=UPI001E8CD233|nr:pectin lyase fold/virulence factor [Filobasidium floriforme]KAH8080064.1 pectin lyase fold/virulence factor [Filobasidium floriforme]
MQLKTLTAILPLLATASAFPSLVSRENDSTPSNKSKTCVVPAGGSNATDDTPAINKAFMDCAKDGTVVFEEGVDYFVMTPFRATNLSNVDIHLKGNIHLPQDIPTVQAIVNATGTAWLSGVWMSLQGDDVSWYGSKNVSSGWIYAYGQAWWDKNAENPTGTGLLGRPHLANFELNNAYIDGWKVRKPIAWNMAISGTNFTIKKTIIDAFTSGGFPFNTDGFDIMADGVVIDGFTVSNGDDAVAIQSGAANVLVQNGYIGHHSHGMSIGSLGQNQGLFASVSNVTIRDITVDGAVYASRIKSWVGGQGLVSNVTYENFRLNNVTFPIFVTQTYFNQGSQQSQIENGAVTGRPNNSSVILKDISFRNFAGNINYYDPGDRSCVSDPCWYDASISDRENPGTHSVVLECSNSTTCSGFTMENIQVFPQPVLEPNVICINVGEESNPDLGFRCPGGNYNGTFVAV